MGLAPRIQGTGILPVISPGEWAAVMNGAGSLDIGYWLGQSVVPWEGLLL